MDVIMSVHKLQGTKYFDNKQLRHYIYPLETRETRDDLSHVITGKRRQNKCSDCMTRAQMTIQIPDQTDPEQEEVYC